MVMCVTAPVLPKVAWIDAGPEGPPGRLQPERSPPAASRAAIAALEVKGAGAAPAATGPLVRAAVGGGAGGGDGGGGVAAPWSASSRVPPASGAASEGIGAGKGFGAGALTVSERVVAESAGFRELGA